VIVEAVVVAEEASEETGGEDVEGSTADVEVRTDEETAASDATDRTNPSSESLLVMATTLLGMATTNYKLGGFMTNSIYCQICLYRNIENNPTLTH